MQYICSKNVKQNFDHINSLFQAVISGNITMLKNMLFKGTKINNGNGKKNTLNLVIRTMFTNGIQIFNLQFIKEVLNLGAEFCQSGDNNTLSMCIEYAIKQKKNIYIRSQVLMQLIRTHLT